MKLPGRVTICEVGTRDGFQIEPNFVPTEQKIEAVNLLAACGLPRIEVTSFVHPKAVPHLRDAEEVMAGIARRPGTVYAALVPNDKGASRAVAAGVDEIRTVLSASETHNLANVNMTVAQSLERMAAVADVAARARVPVTAGIATAFGCPFEGSVDPARVESLVARLAELGVRGINLADTTGMANPAQVVRLCERLMAKWPALEWSLHTHDTRAMAIPNVLAGLQVGVRNFDASVGGLGGCPFAPGATGNVCTEDLVHCLHAMDIETGIALDRLVEAARRVESMVGHSLPGRILRAGPSDRRYPVPEAVGQRLAAG